MDSGESVSDLRSRQSLPAALAILGAKHHQRTTVSNTMKTIVRLLSVGFLAFSTIAAEQASPPVFQMRLVLDTQSADSEQMTLVHKSKDGDDTEPVYVQKSVLLDQTDLKSAMVTTNRLDGRPRIQIVFTDRGKKRFAEVTRQNIGERLAIIIEGQLYSAPRIMTEIPSGTAEIAGNFSEQEARDLAAKILRALHKQ